MWSHSNYVWNYTFQIQTSYFEIYEEDEDTIAPSYIDKTFEVTISKQLEDKSYVEKNVDISYWEVWTIGNDGRLTIEYPVLTKRFMLNLIRKEFWEDSILTKPNLFVSSGSKSFVYYLQSDIFNENISISSEPKYYALSTEEEFEWLSSHWFRTI